MGVHSQLVPTSVHRESGQAVKMWSLCILLLIVSQTLGAWLGENGWDGTFSKYCPSNQVIVAIKSHHNNKHEDRKWNFYCDRDDTAANHIRLGSASLSGYVNNFDGGINYNCPSGRVMTGFYSYHANKQEDRRWRVRCSYLSGKRLTGCQWTGNMNGYDGGMSYCLADNGHMAFVGFQSNHNNHHEDRIWKFKYCTVS